MVAVTKNTKDNGGGAEGGGGAAVRNKHPTSRIRFSSVFPKKAWTILCKTDPDQIWMAWSGFGQMHLVRKQAGVQESSGPVSCRIQRARYQFPTFRLGSVLPQTSQITLCKTSPGPIWFWLIVSGFSQTDPVRKQTGVHESSGPLLANVSQPIRTGCESDPACLLGVTHERTHEHQW